MKKVENFLAGLALVVGGIFLAGGIALLTGLYYAWILMLLIGTLHHNFFPELFPYGFWVCFWPAVLIRIFIAQSTNTTSSSD